VGFLKVQNIQQNVMDGKNQIYTYTKTYTYKILHANK